MSSESKPHSSADYSKAAQQADGIRQMVWEIADEPLEDEVVTLRHKIDKWLNVWVEEHERLEEQYEDLREKLAIEEQERADFEASQARLLEQYGYEKERADREKDRADALLKGYVETQEQAAGLLEQYGTLLRVAAEAYDAMERMDAAIETNSEAGTPDWFVAALTTLNETLGSNPASVPDGSS